jgi:hypothetical protein
MSVTGNICVWNALNIGSGGATTLSEGNLKCVMTGADPRTTGTIGGIPADTDGYYFETVATAIGGGALTLGVVNEDRHNLCMSGQIHSRSGSFMWRSYDNGQFFNATTTVTSYGAFADGDILGWFVKGGKVYVKKNNSNVVGDVAAGSNGLTITGNFFFPAISRTVGGGDATTCTLITDSGSWNYTPPSGFKSLSAKDMTIGSGIDPAGDDGEDGNPKKQFGVVTYAGTGNNGNAITGLGFQPDMLWLKQRDADSDYSNAIVDSSRGRTKVIYSHDTRVERTSPANKDVKSFDSDGFTVDASEEIGINSGTGTYLAWGWKCNAGTTATNTSGTLASTVQANQAAGFSMVQYTSTATDVTIGHGLSSPVDFYFIKKRNDQARDALTYHRSLGPSKYLKLNDSAAAGTDTGLWNNTDPSSTVFHVDGNTTEVNNPSGVAYIAYCWHGVKGMSHFGIFTGTNNTAGAFVYTGFRPKMLFIKSSTAGENWAVFDTARNTYNTVDKGVFWNSNVAETTGSGGGFDIDFISNGFKLRASHDNINGAQTYVYGAWGDVPFKYSNAL